MAKSENRWECKTQHGLDVRISCARFGHNASHVKNFEHILLKIGGS